MLNMSDINFSHQRVLIREDLNVPLDAHGNITHDKRIQAALPTLQALLAQNAAVIAVSHLGRPSEGTFQSEFSLAPVARHLERLLNQPVRLVENWLEGVEVAPGEIVLCENVRFCVGEIENDDALAKKMAALCDIFIMDAFAVAHRAQASTEGVAKYAKQVCAGPLLAAELTAIKKALKNPAKPVVAIIGGSKVSTKFGVLSELVKQVDQLIVGGGIANTFLAARNLPVGNSLYESHWVSEAERLLSSAKESGCDILLPTDVVVAHSVEAGDKACIKSVEEVVEGDMILDIGPKAQAYFSTYLHDAGTILWNGPVGAFEFPAFSEGTRALSKAVAESAAFSVVGGGDTLAAIDQAGISDKISYVSTGGGAFLALLEGKPLPAVAILEERGGKLC